MNNGYYRRLLDNASDLIWATDMEGKIIYMNGKISEWGYAAEELIGRPFLSILNVTRMGKAMSEFDDPGIRDTFEMQVEDRRGTLRRVVVSSAPLEDDSGNIVGMMGKIHDVSETHTLQEKLKHGERLASLGRLATGIAHEIRNPLSAVKMNLDILGSLLNPSGKILQHFQIAKEGVSNLERIVTEFLDYARPAPLRLLRQNLHKAIEETVVMAEPQRNAKEITIVTDFADDMPLALFDKGKIQQALLNILLNAIEASRPGSTVRIETRLISAGTAKIVVSDQGEGISEVNFKFVFDPFFTTKQHGTGIGLSIVDSIMKNHNGSISLSSELGKGTRVELEFPIR